MIVAGVMSGTSADGVDVALCRIAPASVTEEYPGIELLAHEHFPYPADVRNTVLRAMEGGATTPAELSRLNWRLGQLYAECVAATCLTAGINAELVGCHGQTIYHQASATEYLGAPVRATWQIGEASAIAEKLRLPVVSDFRPADLAAGGQGAPLVPMLDLCLFRSQTINRVLLNLGGIANVTAIPAGARIEDVLAFDTGPGNMVIDAVMQRLYGKPFDEDGAVGAKGRLEDFFVPVRYMQLAPPKSCGREEFGSGFVEEFVANCRRQDKNDADIVAIATWLTAMTIVHAYKEWCAPRLSAGPTEMIAAGGGTRNGFLMSLLRDGLAQHGVKLLTVDDLGMASEAKEAVAFALLAWLTWHGKPGNVTAATGASRAVVLGKVTHG